MLCAHHNWLLLTQKEVNLSEIVWNSKLPRKTTVKSLYLSRELKDHYIVACNNKRPVIIFFHPGTTRVCETLHEMNIFSVSRHQCCTPKSLKASPNSTEFKAAKWTSFDKWDSFYSCSSGFSWSTQRAYSQSKFDQFAAFARKSS